MGDVIKRIFSITVKCIGKYGGEWVNVSKENTCLFIL